MGLAVGDAVQVFIHVGGRQTVNDAVVLEMYMQPELAGEHGEMAIGVWVAGKEVRGVVHRSHQDWREGRTSVAYEESVKARRRMANRCSIKVNERKWDDEPRRTERPCVECGKATRGRLERKVLCIGCAAVELMKPMSPMRSALEGRT